MGDSLWSWFAFSFWLTHQASRASPPSTRWEHCFEDNGRDRRNVGNLELRLQTAVMMQCIENNNSSSSPKHKGVWFTLWKIFCFVSPCTPRSWFNFWFFEEELLFLFSPKLRNAGLGGKGVVATCKVSNPGGDGRAECPPYIQRRVFAPTGISRELPATTEPMVKAQVEVLELYYKDPQWCKRRMWPKPGKSGLSSPSLFPHWAIAGSI